MSSLEWKEAPDTFENDALKYEATKLLFPFV